LTEFVAILDLSMLNISNKRYPEAALVNLLRANPSRPDRGLPKILNRQVASKI
jgi:hypothetical protein